MKLTFVLLIWLFAGSALATTVFYGPVPYQERADSPFYAGIQSGDIYVEDFEGPGLKTPNVSYTTGWFGQFTGVDEDDGVLDNRSIRSVWYSTTGVPGLGAPYGHEIRFLKNETGDFPSYAGFALLGFVNESYPLEVSFYFQFFDESGFALTDAAITYHPPRLPDETRSTSTLGNTFVGFYSSRQISRIIIGGTATFDHLQYGWSIPESSSVLLILVGVPKLLIRRRRA